MVLDLTGSAREEGAEEVVVVDSTAVADDNIEVVILEVVVLEVDVDNIDIAGRTVVSVD